MEDNLIPHLYRLRNMLNPELSDRRVTQSSQNTKSELTAFVQEHLDLGEIPFMNNIIDQVSGYSKEDIGENVNADDVSNLMGSFMEGFSRSHPEKFENPALKGLYNLFNTVMSSALSQAKELEEEDIDEEEIKAWIRENPLHKEEEDCDCEHCLQVKKYRSDNNNLYFMNAAIFDMIRQQLSGQGRKEVTLETVKSRDPPCIMPDEIICPQDYENYLLWKKEFENPDLILSEETKEE